MKYTASDDSRVANKALGEAECYVYLSHDSHQELYDFIQTNWQCFIVFTLTKVSPKYNSLEILMLSLNK